VFRHEPNGRFRSSVLIASADDLVASAVVGATASQGDNGTMNRSSRRRAVAAFCMLAALLGLLSGCGSEKGGVFDNFAAAVETTGSARTMRSRLEIRYDGVAGVPDHKEITDMVMSTHPVRGEGTVTQGGQAIEMIVADEAYYYAVPGLPDGKKWVRVTFEQLWGQMGVDVGAASDQDPTKAFDTLRASGDVRKVGEEKIDGTRTTRYVATVEVDRLADRVGAFSNELVDQMKGLFGDSYPVQVWVDDAGYVRRMTYEMDLAEAPEPPEDMPATGVIRYEFRFSDFGMPVDVTVPPAAQVIDVDDLN
jgi:hypothetical protein